MICYAIGKRRVLRLFCAALVLACNLFLAFFGTGSLGAVEFIDFFFSDDVVLKLKRGKAPGAQLNRLFMFVSASRKIILVCNAVVTENTRKSMIIGALMFTYKREQTFYRARFNLSFIVKK